MSPDKAKEFENWHYCENCNKIYKMPSPFNKSKYSFDGVDCPVCEEGELAYLGELTKLQLRTVQYDVANDNFDLEKWRKDLK
ncbi:MAG: hypothetical protein ABEK17_03720 [Candidatus Aenigmatarchaeota archaeon]